MTKTFEYIIIPQKNIYIYIYIYIWEILSSHTDEFW